MKRSPTCSLMVSIGQEEVSFSLNRMSDLFHKIARKLHEHGAKSQAIITEFFHLMFNVMARRLMMWFATKICLTCTLYKQHKIR